MKKLRKIKKIDYRHIICAVVTLGVLACSVFLFPDALGRIVEAFRDFGLSVAYWFCNLFDIDTVITPTVNNYPVFPFFPTLPTVPSAPVAPIPDTFAMFQINWGIYWRLWVDMSNFMGYLLVLGNIATYFLYVILFLIPLVLSVYYGFSFYMKKQNNKYDADSKPLKLVKKISKRTYIPAKRFVVGFVNFVKNNRAYLILWLIIALFSFNIFTIFIEFLAYYMYFSASFDFVNLYRQIYKLSLDLTPMFTIIPLWVWGIVVIILIDRFRRRIGYARLHHYEMCNRGFINARPIVYMLCGTMGKKKTTLLTDMALSQVVMFRDKAFEKLLEADMKFPFFPWVNLENKLKKAIRWHKVYSLATVEKYINELRFRYADSIGLKVIFGYNCDRYGMFYDDKLAEANIWNVIETYAKLYFIYIMQSSFLISNFSIRTDSVIADVGNFPLWDNDFFKRDSRLLDSFSRHAHILDFDSLRLGQKMLKHNALADGFEFGVVTITEIGKERGNTLELREVKKGDETTNQKNDGFNNWLKMVRHSATVDNHPFVRVIVDEQRPESWGADARDLCEIVHIKDGGEPKLAMPLFTLGELLYSFIFGRFVNLYTKYRYNRGDNTLFMYFFKSLTAKIEHHYKGIYNTFGYCKMQLQVEAGTQDGELKDSKYYLMNKKIYSKRFSTDCFSDYFTEKALRSDVGIEDIREFETEKASFYEMLSENSYFFNDLVKLRMSAEEKKPLNSAEDKPQ